MSEYTPTTQQVEDGFSHEPEYEYINLIGYGAHVQSNRRAFRRWLAELEREAAAKALTDAAHQFATQDGLEALMFARDDVAAVRVTEKWLIDRAAALGLTAGQVGEKA